MKQLVAVAVAVLCTAGFAMPSFSEMGQEKLLMSEMKGETEKQKGGTGGTSEPCSERDPLPCLTTTVTAGSNPNCPNGGRRCNAPGAQCTKMSGANGTCVDMMGGGFCNCSCM
jgi:hypothetical protein